MAIECSVCGGQWWLGSKWAKDSGEAHPSIQQYEVSIPQVPIVEGAAADALICEILESN